MSEPNSVQQILRGAGTCPGQTEHESHAVLQLVARLVQPLLALDNLGIAFGNTSDGGAVGHARVPRSLCRRAGESRWSVRMAPPHRLSRTMPPDRATMFCGHGIQLDPLGRWSRPTDQDLLGCLLGAGDRWFAFDEDAAFESCAGADERDEVWCVDRAPALLCGLDQLERHRDPGGP